MVLVALVHQLVCARNERQIVYVTELVRHLVTEKPSCMIY
jgi:hypothetical protein